MKTFKQYITEADVETLEDYLVEHCHHFLSALDADVEETISQPLYRGIITSGDSQKLVLLVDGKTRNCLIKNVRGDREPLDTPPQISKIVDDAFEHIFGWRPRSQAMFCTGSKSQAGSYGKLYQVFPIGKFKYVWSPDVGDMIGHIKRILRQLVVPYLSPEKMTSDNYADVYEHISDFIGERYMEAELQRAVSKHREIMMGCKTYLAVPA